MSVKVKICGPTNLPDAQAAVQAGADLLGFIFAETSPRRLTVAAAPAGRCSTTKSCRTPSMLAVYSSSSSGLVKRTLWPTMVTVPVGGSARITFGSPVYSPAFGNGGSL